MRETTIAVEHLQLLTTAASAVYECEMQDRTVGVPSVSPETLVELMRAILAGKQALADGTISE